MWKIKLGFYGGILILLCSTFDITEAIITYIVFLVCFNIANCHFNSMSNYSKFIGVIHKLFSVFFLLIPMEISRLEYCCFCNIFVSLIFYISYKYKKDRNFEADLSKIAYFLLIMSVIVPIIISLDDFVYFLPTVLDFPIFLFPAFCISLWGGGTFSENISKIKGKYSYFFIGIWAILLCGGVSLLEWYSDGDIKKNLILNLSFLSFSLVIILLINRILKNKLNYEDCPICKSLNHKDDKECNNNRCRIFLDKPYPVCPKCGVRIDPFYTKKCSRCGFDWFTYFKHNIQSSMYSLVNVDSCEDADVYKIELKSGDFVTEHSKVLKSKFKWLDDINIYGKDWKSSKSLSPKAGILFVLNDTSKFSWCVFSPKFYNETHKEYEQKVEREKLEKMRREAQIEVEQQLQEEERIRKEKEQTEVEKRKAEEIKLHKQEHARKISEQIGIILD